MVRTILALLLVPMAAWADPLPSLPWYPLSNNGNGGFAQGVLLEWWDPSYPALTGGGPRAASPTNPLPIQCMSGCSGGGGGGSVPTAAPGTSASQAVPMQGVTGGVPVSVSWNGMTVTLGAGSSVIGAVQQSGAWTVALSTPLPAGTNALGSVSVSNLPSTQAVSGTVAVSNLPGTQPVSGTLGINNFPATQAVSAAALPLPAGAATAANQPSLNGDGGALAHITNFPASQAVTGTVGVSGTVATQDVNSAAFQGVAAITPGAPVVAARSLGFVVTAGGPVTLTFADGSTLTLTLAASSNFQSLPFAVTNVALGSGTAGAFWNMK